MKISLEKIKELREKTGIGTQKCKNALEEAGGDIELAISNLRKQGLEYSKKKEGRKSQEGIIAVAKNDGDVALVEVNAETDFVVKNDDFRDFSQAVADVALQAKLSSVQELLEAKCLHDSSLTIDQYRSLMIQKIGENIVINRVKIFFQKSGETIGIYNHMKGKSVALVGLNGNDKELADDIAMHVVAMSPEYLKEENVPEEVLVKEREIAKEQMKDKPSHIIDKIVSGKMKSFYDDNCLLYQGYVKDPKVTIKQLLESHSSMMGFQLFINFYSLWKIGDFEISRS